MKNTLIEEKLIIRNALNGDRSANEVLYQFIKSNIRSQIYYFNNSRDQSSFLAHDLTAKVFEKLHLFNPEHKLKTWVARVVQNALIDDYRSRKRCPVFVPIDTFEMTCKDQSDSFSGHFSNDRDEKLRLLNSAIDTLNISDKYLLNQHLFIHRKQKDLAKELNISVSSLNSKLNRLRGKLKKHILILSSINLSN